MTGADSDRDSLDKAGAEWTRSRQHLRLFLCGDVMTARGVDQAMAHPAPPELRERYVESALTYVALAEKAHGPIERPIGYEELWGDALEVWRRAAPDVRLCNLETAITRCDDFGAKGIHYRTSPENAACLTAARFDACTLANNHVLDFGRTGLTDTLDALERLGVRAVGAGRRDLDAAAPVAIPVAGKQGRVIVVAAAFEDSGVPRDWRAGPHTAGVNLVEPTEDSAAALAAGVGEVRAPEDVAVVSIHWGSNWGYEIPAAHRRFAHALIDSGEVAIVHGHSSHHSRPIEVYRNRLILYGCGDYLNDYEGIEGYEAFRSGIVAMYFADLDQNGGLERLELVPLSIRGLRLNRASPEEAAWLRERLSRECRPFGVDLSHESDGRLLARWGKPGASDELA